MAVFDFFIVGGGIAGKVLGYKLLEQGYKIIIFQNDKNPDTSVKSSAVLNPYNLKKGELDLIHSRRIQESIKFYNDLQQYSSKRLIEPLYIQLFEDSIENDDFIFHFHKSKILEGVCKVNTEAVLETLNNCITQENIINESLDTNLIIEAKDGITYQNFNTKHIIFCGGVNDRNNRLISHLPFTKNRGDFLIVEIENLPPHTIFHHRYRLVPLGDNLYWYGSNNTWDYNDLEPNIQWRKEALNHLKNWIKNPFKLIKHEVAERPTTAGQFPFIGLLPRNKNVGVFNGFGTRGYSLIPYYAANFVDYLIGNTTIIKDYDMDKMKNLSGKYF